MAFSRAMGVVLGVLVLVASASPARAGQGEQQSSRAAVAGGAELLLVAQGQGTEQPELRPRYEPVPPEAKPSYNSSYVFGMTRGVANSTIHPAGKVPLFVLTVPLDIVFLPFAVIGGFFG